MYIFLKNKNSCWDNNDKRGFLLFLTKQLLSGSIPISEIQIIFLVSRACGVFPPDFLTLACILFFILSYMFHMPRKQKSSVWASTTGIFWNWDWFRSAKNVLFSCTAGDKTEKVPPCNISVSRSWTEAGLPRNVQAGYPHLQLLNCTGRAN